MNEMKKKQTILLIGFLFAFVVFTMGVVYYDVRMIGPMNSYVGFARFNTFMHDLLGVNMLLYTVTDWLGIIPLAIGCIFGFVGLVQLMKRRSIKKVDQNIIMLGIFYLMLIIVYVFFETVVINYRPILIDGYLEPSYPSTHVMMSLCVIVTAYLMVEKMIRQKQMQVLINVIFSIVLLVIVIGRLLSGVHWMTDIIGGFLLSGILISLFVIGISSKKQE